MSLDDTYRQLKAAHPHAKISNIDVLDPAKQTAKQQDSRWNRKAEDEKKRSVDEMFHASKCSHRTRHIEGFDVGGVRWYLEIGCGELKPKDDPPRDHRWTILDRYQRQYTKADWKRHQCAGCDRAVFQPPTSADRTRWLCPRCRYENGFVLANEDMKGFNSKRAKAIGGRMYEAGGEIVSESMVPPPERGVDHIAERWRADGRLQVRKMGTYTHEVAVFKSRKHMEASMREFNRDSPDVKIRNKWGGEKAPGSGCGRYPD